MKNKSGNLSFYQPVRCLILIKFLTERTKKSSEKWDERTACLRNNKTLLYLMPTTFFIVAMVVVFTHGLIVNNNIDFEVVQVNHPQPFETYDVTVTALSFNPEDSVHRMDLFFETNAYVDLFNYQLEANAVALVDPSQPLEVEIVRVTSQFYVIYISDLPVDFEAIRTDMMYFVDEDKRATTTIRTQDIQSNVDYELSIEKDRMALMSDALANDIRILEVQITEFEVEIALLEEQITTNLSHIEQLENDIEFQVGEQLTTSQTRIGTFLNQNANLENEIKELENEIEDAQTHIEVITETINNF